MGQGWVKQGEGSVHALALRPLLGKQHLDSLEYPHPYSPSIQVALVQQLVDPYGGVNWWLVAVSVNQQAGRAPDVEVGGQLNPATLYLRMKVKSPEPSPLQIVGSMG